MCHNRRIRQHQVFRGLAERGKTSVDWLFGFTLHLVFNDQGEILTFTLTPGQGDDRAPVPPFAKHLFGTLFGDKGYLSQALQNAEATSATLWRGVHHPAPQEHEEY